MTWLYLPSNSLLESGCSAKVGALHSAFSDTTAEPFATWSGKLLLPASLSRLWKRERLMQRLCGLTFEPSQAQRFVIEWIASLPVSRVRTFLSQGDAQGSTGTAPGSSSTFSTSRTLAVRGASFWRTSQVSLLPPPPLWTKPKANFSNARPPESWENWPTAVGMRNACLFERPTLELRISASDGSASRGGAGRERHGMAGIEAETGKLGAGGEFAKQIHQWATPDASATERTNRSRSVGATVRPTLALAAASWATPRATDGTKGGPNQAGSNGDMMLPSMAAHWATPRASMATNGSDSGSANRQKQGQNLGLKDQTSAWATPTARDHKDGATTLDNVPVNGLLGRQVLTTSLRPVHSMIDGRELSPTARTLRRRLNPAFACWLMGWPIWWTNPAITSSVKSETELWRSRLQQQLSSFFDEPDSRADAAASETLHARVTDMKTPKFFWLGETSEIFVAESIFQLIDDRGHCGTGIERCSLSPTDWPRIFDSGDEEMEWGEFDGSERMTIRDSDENDRYCGSFTGNLHDIYARFNGGRFEMPVMLLSQYA